jgi:hypothetical protein
MGGFRSRTSCEAAAPWRSPERHDSLSTRPGRQTVHGPYDNQPKETLSNAPQDSP